jgi:hypothetical protein
VSEPSYWEKAETTEDEMTRILAADCKVAPERVMAWVIIVAVEAPGEVTIDGEPAQLTHRRSNIGTIGEALLLAQALPEVIGQHVYEHTEQDPGEEHGDETGPDRTG